MNTDKLPINLPQVDEKTFKTPAEQLKYLSLMVGPAAAISLYAHLVGLSTSTMPRTTHREDSVFRKLIDEQKGKGHISSLNEAYTGQGGSHYNPYSKVLNIDVMQRTPGIVAHEIGHAMSMGGKPIWNTGAKTFGYGLGNAVGGIFPFLTKDKETAKNEAILGTVMQAPRLYEEINASRLGAKLLRAQGLRGRAAFIGLPTYLISALLPAASYSGSRMLYKDDKVKPD